MKKFRVGMIGLGTISDNHLKAYVNDGRAELVAISDLNEALAKEKANAFGITSVYTDYKELLADDSIDAVSIATPTFTHMEIVCDALRAGKHVLCEKPPALTADEVRKCKALSEETGKVLMFAFIRRFNNETKFLKSMVDNGEFGNIYYAEAARCFLCSQPTGWFTDKEKSGGGMLIDGAIHELDVCLHLMGYPKPKSVLGYTSDINRDLPGTMKGMRSSYQSAIKKEFPKTVETMASALITFQNGSCLHVKSSSVLNYFSKNGVVCMDLCGEKAGVHIDDVDGMKIIRITDDRYFREEKPMFTANVNGFEVEISHFIDCCLDDAECLVKPEEAVILMQIINAVYESATTGKTVTFDE